MSLLAGSHSRAWASTLFANLPWSLVLYLSLFLKQFRLSSDNQSTQLFCQKHNP
jgi:hypothetical protein